MTVFVTIRNVELLEKFFRFECIKMGGLFRYIL